MATQEIDIWANTIVLDPIKGNPQRREIYVMKSGYKVG